MTLSLELLEDRTLLSAYIVTTTADSGVGSLRDAITQINADTSHSLYASPTDPTKDEIDFDIPTSDPGYNSSTASFTIQPTAVPDPTGHGFTGLPIITNPVIINGYTQPGASPNTLAGGDNAVLEIELNGANAGASSGVGLVLDAPNCTVEGLVINGFGAYAVWTLADGETISGNFIGTDVTGTTAVPNSTSTTGQLYHPGPSFSPDAQNGAVQVYGNNNVIGGTDPAARNVISGNDADGIVISGFGADGVFLDPVTGTDVMGNFIGTDTTGTQPLGNASDGIGVFGQNTTIGGTTAGAGNIISANTGTQYLDENGFAGNGVYTGGDVGTVIEGNYIGTDVSGTQALGNAENGVGLGFASTDTVGGTTPGAGNLISGNLVYGVAIGVSENCQVEGNLIGTDVTGTLPLGNGEGVFDAGNTGLVIGGTAPDARNVISGNSFAGVDLRGAGTQVQGNYIGTDISGTFAIANGRGVYIADEAQDNTIGGLTHIPGTGAGNLISGNGYGIVIESGIGGTADNAVEGNLIGTDRTGLAALPNVYGVTIAYLASDNTIGGTTPGTANVISDNTGDSVTIMGGTISGGTEATPTGNLVQGNFIGTAAGGVAALSNGGDGILVEGGASNNSIGGTSSGAANTIADNTGDGVAVTGNTSTGNLISGNSIFDNGNLGIDLLYNLGANAGNTGEPAPVLMSAIIAGGLFTVTGSVPGKGGDTLTLEFFSNPSGVNAEGQVYLGAETLTMSADPSDSFTATLPASDVPAGSGFFTATDTDGNNNTSQFSSNMTTTTVVSSSLNNTSIYGQSVTFTATVDAGVTPVTAGTVTFDVNGSPYPGASNLPLNASGQASFSISTLSVAGGPYTITAVYSGTPAVLAMSQANVSQTITPAALTITANNATKVQGTTNPTFTAAYNGFVNGDSTSNLSGTLTFSTTATTSSPAGNYPIVPSGLTATNYTITYSVAGTLTITPPAPTGSISGTTFLDQTGNGFSADDTALAGVIIRLYEESNNTPGLQNSTGGDTLVNSTTTNSSGTFSFTGLPSGTYYVQQVVPAGDVQTGGGPNETADGNTYYTIAVVGDQSYPGNNFDDYQKPTCLPTHVSFLINHCTTVTDLRGNTQAGDTVQVTFTVSAGMTDQLSIVTYTAPEPAFDAATAGEQEIFDQATGAFSPGTHTMTVQIPDGYYQIDFVCGPAIDHLGLAGSNIFYSAEGRLLSADNGGTEPCLTHSQITGSFNGTAIAAGNTLWFSSALNVNGLSSNTTTVVDLEDAAISFTAGGHFYTVPVPNAEIIYSPTATASSTSFDALDNRWVTTVPTTGLSGNQLLDAVAFPVTTALPGGIQNVTWDGNLVSNKMVSVNWKWAAAVYPTSQFSTNYNALGVKPVDDNQTSQYRNSDHAGTPENFKNEVIGGATGGGGSNYTGSLSATAGVSTCAGTPVTREDAATISFWDNQNGQTLIDSLNGGSSSTALAQWLATTFPNLYGPTAGVYSMVNGNGSYFTNAQVASSYINYFFNVSGQRTNAQILASALAVYCTSSTLAGGIMAESSPYNFNVSSHGIGSHTIGVGSKGGFFGVPDNDEVSVLTLLEITNSQASRGIVSSSLLNAANTLFSNINQEGDV